MTSCHSLRMTVLDGKKRLVTLQIGIVKKPVEGRAGDLVITAASEIFSLISPL